MELVRYKYIVFDYFPLGFVHHLLCINNTTFRKWVLFAGSLSRANIKPGHSLKTVYCHQELRNFMNTKVAASANR
jgi:hypothetical protein